MRDIITKWCRPSLAGRKPRISPVVPVMSPWMPPPPPPPPTAEANTDFCVFLQHIAYVNKVYMDKLELFACHMNVCLSFETSLSYLDTPLTTSYPIEMQFTQYDSKHIMQICKAFQCVVHVNYLKQLPINTINDFQIMIRNLQFHPFLFISWSQVGHNCEILAWIEQLW